MIKREKCYPGTNVKVTSGLFVLECENGHRGWYLVPTDVCAKCGAEIMRGDYARRITNSSDYRCVSSYLKEKTKDPASPSSR